MTVTTYEHLQVSPFQLVSLQEVKLTKKINEHAKLWFTAIVPEELKDEYVKMTESNPNIELNQMDQSGNSIPLFKGVILSIQVKVVRDIYYLEVEAASHTYHLDLKKNQRSFQDAGMTFAVIFQQVGAAYPGIDIIDEVTKGSPIGKLTLQYYETDWEFLMRLASRFNTGLVPAATFSNPKFYFGIPSGREKGKLEDYHYSVRKRLSDFLIYTGSGNQGVVENDFIYYEVETDKVLEIGDKVSFQEETLYVCEVLTTMKEGVLKHLYTISTKQGMNQKEIFNDQIAGVSLEGKVLEVAGDRIKVHLNIDPNQDKGKAHLFPYATIYAAEGHSGWYSMPEVNDNVQVYFPTNKDEEAVATSSVRKNTEKSESNKLDNPSVKYLRTAGGKEIMLSPNEVVITAKDEEVFIRLNENNGIEIFSKKEIKLISEQDISMNSSQKIILSAAEQIAISCKESNITLDGNVGIFGNEVKAN